MNKTVQANWVLLFVTFIWGATFPIISIAVHHISGNAFVLIRFILASLILLPFAFKEFRYTHKKLFWLCVLLGIGNCVVYACQTVGLETIEPTQSAFITGLNIIFVPFIVPFFKLGKLRAIDVACALLCLFGLYLLTGANIRHISHGEILTLICAVAYAFCIVLMQKISKETSHYKLVTFYQILFTTVLIIPFAYHQNFQTMFMPQVLLPILFCAIIATTVVLFLQVRYQQYTTASKAALIYAFEPVFAGVISYLFFHTAFTKQMLLGAGFIMFGTLLSDIKNIISEKLRPTPQAYIDSHN
ncbi:MAG: DMT family transporter [Gammaproteobacteria bacterium]|nr:DMT family transporter [Gammaproteobacteria bacterium]